MPWETIADAKKHNKEMTDSQAKTWLKVANSARDKCVKDGGNEITCDASAIKQANSVIGNIAEALTQGAWKYCVCTKCNYHEDHIAGKPCAEKKCPKCGAMLKGANEKIEAIESKEGLLADELDFDKQDREINDLCWKASSLLGRIVRNLELNAADKKKQINEVLDDFEKELGKRSKAVSKRIAKLRKERKEYGEVSYY
jgi:hypothetical protein